MRVEQFVKPESDSDKQDGQHAKAEKLNRSATESVDRGDSNPITGNGTSDDEDKIADSLTVEELVDILATGPSDCTEDEGVVQTKTVESCDS